MPLKLEPGQTFDVYLKTDAEKPPETRPTFMVNVVSVRDSRNIANAIEQLTDLNNLDTTDQFYDGLLDLAEKHVAGWRNMGQEFSREALQDLLTYLELRELLNWIQLGQHMTADEKKSSESSD